MSLFETQLCFPSSLPNYEMLSFKHFSGIKSHMIRSLYTDRLSGWNSAKAADAWHGPTLSKVFQYCFLNYYVIVNKLFSILLGKLVTADIMYYSKWLEPCYLIFCLKTTSESKGSNQPAVNCCLLLCRVWLLTKK